MNGQKSYKQIEANCGRAFTFVEVMAALAIVSISLLALLKLHLISITMADRAQLTSEAVLLANEKVEETLAMGYPALAAGSGTVAKDNCSLQWQTEVTEQQIPSLNEAGIEGLRKVSVNVTWKQGRRRKCVQMSSYVADRKVI